MAYFSFTSHFYFVLSIGDAKKYRSEYIYFFFDYSFVSFRKAFEGMLGMLLNDFMSNSRITLNGAVTKRINLPSVCIKMDTGGVM